VSHLRYSLKLSCQFCVLQKVETMSGSLQVRLLFIYTPIMLFFPSANFRFHIHVAYTENEFSYPMMLSCLSMTFDTCGCFLVFDLLPIDLVTNEVAALKTETGLHSYHSAVSTGQCLQKERRQPRIKLGSWYASKLIRL